MCIMVNLFCFDIFCCIFIILGFTLGWGMHTIMFNFFLKIDLYVQSKIVWSQDNVSILVCFESMVLVVCGDNKKM